MKYNKFKTKIDEVKINFKQIILKKNGHILYLNLFGMVIMYLILLHIMDHYNV